MTGEGGPAATAPGPFGEVDGALPRAVPRAGLLRPLGLRLRATDEAGSVSYEATFRVDAGGLERAPDMAVDVVVSASLAALLRWLHEPEVLLGHLLLAGATASGDLAALSAVEGVVSGPAVPPATGPSAPERQGRGCRPPLACREGAH